VLSQNHLGFGHVGGTARVEYNVATSNAYGFESDTGGADYGGGALGSAGGNTVSCNSIADLWVSTGGIAAANNFWDHVPPTISNVGPGGGVDIYDFAGATAPTTTGAAFATGGCP
jgi:hypothetical protein